MAEQLKLLQPEQYHSLFLEKSIRPDGRKPSAFGETCISVGCISTANGSALVNLRETTVICGIKAELVNPSAEHPDRGFVIPNVDFPAVCSSTIMPGPPPVFVQLQSQLIVDLLENTSFIDLTKLCISEGKLSWCLHVDISCLNYSGNVLDAIILALTAAATNTMLPDVSMENDKIEVKSSMSALKINELVFSSTFGIFGKEIIADPTREEESLSTGLVTVFMKESGLLCNVFMPTGCVDESCLKQCIQLARKRCKKLASLVNKLEPDVKN